MKKIMTLMLAFALFGGAASAQERDFDKATLAKVGSPAPEFTVKMLDGTTINSADLAGKVVWVNFWATWCPPCRSEFKRLQSDVYDRYADRKDFVFIPISRGEKPGDVEKFLNKMGYTFTSGLDEDKTIYELFAADGIPRTFVIGKDGKIAIATYGYEAGEFDALLAEIEAMLK